MNKEGEKITFSETCKILGKSERTLSRYIKKGLLNPEKVKTQKGTEYRFNLAEMENLKKPDTTGQTTRQYQKAIKNDDDTLSVIKASMKLLQKQLKAKDNQINKLLERQRETNILMGQLHIMGMGWQRITENVDDKRNIIVHPGGLIEISE